MPRSETADLAVMPYALQSLAATSSGVRAVDLAAADARIVQQIGRAIDQVAGDAAARQGDLVVARVDRDGAAVDFPGDDEVGPDIDQARLPRPRPRQRRALQELGARGQRPVVRHRLAGAADAHVLPADEAIGADLDGHVIRAGAERSRHSLSLRRIEGFVPAPRPSRPPGWQGHSSVSRPSPGRSRSRPSRSEARCRCRWLQRQLRPVG